MTVVGGLEFGWRNVATGLVEPPVVEPVDVVQGGDLDLPGGPPGSAVFDQLGLVQADHGLGERVVVSVAGGADGGADPGGGEPLGERDGCVLGSGVVVVDQPGQVPAAVLVAGPQGLFQGVRTRAVFMDVAARQPRIGREQASMTNATYTIPAQAGT